MSPRSDSYVASASANGSMKAIRLISQRSSIGLSTSNVMAHTDPVHGIHAINTDVPLAVSPATSPLCLQRMAGRLRLFVVCGLCEPAV